MRKPLKFLLLTTTLALLGALLLSAGCTVRTDPPPIAYEKPENWAILPPQGDSAATTQFDLFYIYPTLTASRTQPLMRWHDNPPLRAKAVAFAAAQTEIFGRDARVFAPLVRQLELHRCQELLGQLEPSEFETTLMRTGIADTARAFRHYQDNYHKEGRPYLLFGHSQGAMDLYMLLKNTPEITREKGFVAAYLIGLPHMSREQIRRDFAGRAISTATGRTDTGVLILWNTQNREATDRIFAGPGSCGINPLNWRTDETPASADANAGAVFYNPKTHTRKRVPKFCGAVLDTRRGALIVELPSQSEWDTNGRFGKGVFHSYDVWFFAENLKANAADRVRAWQQEFHRP